MTDARRCQSRRSNRKEHICSNAMIRVACCRYFMVADTIAHEMAHLWCGDLVTMSWWSDLWLNVCYGPMSLASALHARLFRPATCQA